MENVSVRNHKVRVYPSRVGLPKERQLAWKLAELAADHTPLTADVEQMIISRIMDNAGVAIAAINRPPVRNARSQALAHPRPGGAALFGLPAEQTFEAEWAAWANGVAVRELDLHDTFLAADYAHPGDNIPPLVAVAQQCSRTGKDLLQAVATAYEVQIDLVKGICLHKHKIDHIAHLGPAVTAGIGTLLGLDTDTIYQAIQHALHVTCTTRQSRKGEISSWKAYAPAHAGKLAIEAIDRAMRGEKSPSPIYEGEDGVVAYLLDGPQAEYHVPLPEPGEPKQAILESYPKAHSAEYQAQALIDLAFRLRSKIADFDEIDRIVIHTSHHTHAVIGSGAGDPQKLDPNASRETLDHSLMYIFAVALQDGVWHHVHSYTPERARREDTVRLWHKISTMEDPAWTRRYHDPDPARRAFGAAVTVTFKNGKKLTDEIAVADAHPEGLKPFMRPDYIQKFDALTHALVSAAERGRFLDRVQQLAALSPEQLQKLNIRVPAKSLENRIRDQRGIF